MSEATLHVPTVLEGGILLQEYLAGLAVNMLLLAALHTVQAKAVECILGLADGDVDGVLEIVGAYTRGTGGGLWFELELLQLRDDLRDRIY